MENLSLNDENAALDALMADLGLTETPEEILVEAVMDVENHEAVASMYAQQENTEAPELVIEAATPEVTFAEPKAAPPKPKRMKKEKTDPTAPKRVYFSSRIDAVSAKLGADLSNYLVLVAEDAAKSDEALKADQSALIESFKTLGKKVQNRVSLVLQFVSGRSATLNPVIKEAVSILKTEGKLTVGDKGNFLTKLTGKYSVASARAMGGNTVLALKNLKVIVPGSSGEWVVNPSSLMYPKLAAMV